MRVSGNNPGATPNDPTGGFAGVAGGFGSDVLTDMIGEFGGTAPTAKLAELFEAIDAFLTNLKMKFERHSLLDPTQSVAYVVTDEEGAKYAYVLVPSTSANFASGEFPASGYLQVAHRSLNEKIGSFVHMVNAVVVTPQDMDRAENWGRAIAMSLRPQIDPRWKNMTASELANREYTITTDQLSAKNFFAQFSPHAVPARNDIGITVSFRKPANGDMQFYGQDLSRQSRPFMAISAMVDVLGPYTDHQGRTRFQPVVTVTEILSFLPVFGSIIIGATMAVQALIINGGWKIPFSSFSENGMDLGNLIPDPENQAKLWRADTIPKRDGFIQEYIDPPLFAIDIAEGRHRIPDMWMFQEAEQQAAVVNETARFFNVQPPVTTEPVFRPVNVEFDGFYGEAGGVLADTRDLSYLKLTAKNGAQALQEPAPTILRTYTKNPLPRAKLLLSMTSFTPLYQITRSLLTGTYMSWVSSLINQSNIRLVDPNTSQSTIPLSTFAPQFNNFSTFMPIIRQPGDWGGNNTGGMYL